MVIASVGLDAQLLIFVIQIYVNGVDVDRVFKAFQDDFIDYTS